VWRRIVLPGRSDGWSERPVVRDGVVAVGCSWEKAPPGRVPVLAIHDLDGSPGFVVGYEATGAWEVQTSEPAIAGHVIRAAVYEHECELVVVAATADGTELPRTSLGSAYPLHASDAGSKLMTRITAVSEDSFIVSYAYRQVREYFVGRFHDGANEAVWHAKEWLATASERAVLGYTRPQERGARVNPLDPNGTQLVCRDPRDGRVRWERAGSFVDVVGIAGDAVVLVDRTPRYAELRERERALDEGFLAGRVTDEEMAAEVGRDVWPTVPMTIRVVDVVTGADLATHDVDGEVISAHASEGLVSVITCDREARGELITWRGAGVTRTFLPIGVRRSWPPAYSTPAIVGHAGDAAVWADVDAIHAARPITLPFPIWGFEPRMADRRLARANAVVAYGHIYARADDGLWIAATG
jgi:hypothetical protein